jgi:hypothetical protein
MSPAFAWLDELGIGSRSQHLVGFLTVYYQQWPATLGMARRGTCMPDARNRILRVEDDRSEELVDRGFEVSIAYNGQVSIFLWATGESSLTPRRALRPRSKQWPPI